MFWAFSQHVPYYLAVPLSYFSTVATFVSFTCSRAFFRRSLLQACAKLGMLSQLFSPCPTLFLDLFTLNPCQLLHDLV